MPEWKTRGEPGDSNEYSAFCENVLRTSPKTNCTNGFFVAVFERIDNGETEGIKEPVKLPLEGKNKKRKVLDGVKIESDKGENSKKNSKKRRRLSKSARKRETLQRTEVASSNDTSQ
jgi:hypothetical protein